MTEAIFKMLQEVLRGERTGSEAIDALEEVLVLCASNGRSDRIALAEAIASNMLFNDPSYAEQQSESARLWLAYKCTDPTNLAPGQLFIAGSLLYDKEDYKNAADVFKVFLDQCSDQNSDEFFRASLLTAYCYEALARGQNNYKHVDEGLQVLQNLKERLMSADQNVERERSAEITHALGHLHIARSLLSSAKGKTDRQQGINYLLQASSSNPAYMSCYTSVYSEVGDHLTTIQVSLDELEKETYRQVLEHEDANTVEMEILFYIAHAYSCIGEYDKAIQCFATFSDRMKSLGRNEAHAHGQLFMLKTHLKRSMLEDLTSSDIAKFSNKLREISFPSRSSQSVSDEAKRYEDVLDFLRCLVDHQEKNDEPPALNDLYLESLQVLSKLAETVKEVAAQPIVLVMFGPDDDSARMNDIFEDLTSYRWMVTECSFSSDWRSRKMYEEIVFVIGDANGVCSQVIGTLEREKFVIAFSRPNTEDVIGHLCVSTDVTYLKQVLVISTAFSLCKRFMIQNRYIFALAPCENSPALKYQKPRLTFADYLLALR
jgi:tetratricopeptide (TPR) repeat protein